jgi:hypothetical protein
MKSIWPFSVISEYRKEAQFWKAQYKEAYALAVKLSEYAPKPTCKHCGGHYLEADPAGYYYDAERWDGAPLMCVGSCKKTC